MNNTAISANKEKLIFKNESHRKFYEEWLPKCQMCIRDRDNTGGALSFAPVSSGRGGLVIGNHSFY